jgi:molybdate transport system substrate-binding protein
MRTWLTIAAAVILAVASRGAAQSAEITILSGMGSYSGIRDLAEAFSKATGHKANAVFETQLNAKLNANAPADVVAAGPDQMEDLLKQGKVVPGTDTPFTLAPLGIAVKSGAPKPNIGTPDAFKAAMLNAKSIGYSNGGSGLIAAKVMEKLGIAAQLKARTKFINGRPVAEDVAKGEVEIGIQQINVLLPVAGADYVGPLPGELQDYVLFSTGVLAVSKQVDAASAFQKFAAAPESAALLRKSGMEPWHGGR